ncbi:MAG: response regulator [Candidatus Omnitrophica bacterium]|nr:response regulator [Candidatus Omnitrophota bacterium]MDD5552803.1 response regulator [Candidatus Omnitrophota bacterium]
MYKDIKVLVVDDEKIVRDFFKRLLSLLGMDNMFAENGYKAIELVKNERFDLFFIDVRMPGLNGLDTYREIRKINPEAASVMITGYAVEEILEQAKREGVYSAIRKPFDINQIKDVIESRVIGLMEKVRGGEKNVFGKRSQEQNSYLR